MLQIETETTGTKDTTVPTCPIKIYVNTGNVANAYRDRIIDTRAQMREVSL